MTKIIQIPLIILLFSSYLSAQDNFKSSWLEVEKLEVDNLPKSALKIVDEIYAKAEKEKNAAQIIKSLFYKSKFSLLLEEDAKLKVIDEFKKHISYNEFPTKNILENVLANLYWQYFNQNKYKFYNRTKTEDKIDANDFRTWDLNTLFEEIHCYFETSLQNREELQKTDIYNFTAILQVQKGSKVYRPTLYDFLANNALSFYKSSETSITRPSYKFEIDAPKFLGDAKTFSTLNLQSDDRYSLQFNALKIYQNLIKFHQKNNNLAALVDIDIHRINFVNQHATFNNKEEILLSSLKKAQETYKKHDVSGLYDFEIAKIYRQHASNYLSSKNEKDRFKNNDALLICNKIIKQFPKSIAAKKCTILKTQIHQKSIKLTAEAYIPVDKNSRLLISYKNINKLYFSGYKVSKEQVDTFNKTYKFDEKINFINSLEKVKTWEAELRNENDFLQHTTEVIVPEFKNGRYLLLASESKVLSTNNIFGTTEMQVTNLTLISNDFDDTNNYQVVDRNNGTPIKNAEIHLKNKKTRRGAFINKKLTTDSNGFVSFKSKDYYQNIVISVTTENDTATFGNYYLYEKNRNNYDNNNVDQIKIKPFIFTDRSIYRPGQIVYFKAIVLKKQGDTSEVFKNEYVEVSLLDVNNQVVKTLDLKLNEFGSVAGEFILPNNGLTGEFSIEIEESNGHDSEFYDKIDFDFSYNNAVTFAVEEYKRPKFKTEFKSVTDSYKINDSIIVNGFAKAFSGATITDAKVVYRVHRKVQYPNWWFWYRPRATSEAQEITHGESSTDASGNFSIKFKAMPDEKVSRESNPIFNYEISTDITDINGETRSATTIVKVGYHTLLATFSLDDKIDKNDARSNIIIDTKNLNGEFLAAKGSFKIYKLVSPVNPQRKRVWPAPDYQDISENTFLKLFPNEPFSEEEADEKNWEKGSLVFNTTFNTETSKEINLKNTKKWISGRYIAILESKDKFGQAVKDQKKFTVFATNEKQVADHKLFSINTNKTMYTIDDVVEIQIGSASKDITVVVQTEKNHRIVNTQLIQLKNNVKTIKIPVTKDDIGGFAIKYHYVNYNEFNSGSILINVPEIEESKIEIETNIFRDKLQPGQNETWSFTIKNDKKDRVAAEVLASMYDASLDEFKTHNWQFNPITPKASYYSYGRSNANQSFKNTSFRIVNNRQKQAYFPSISYDSYNWFGFSLNSNTWQYRNYVRQLKNKIQSSRKDFDGSISGVIEDESGPLPGVSVIIKGTTFGTETDFDGFYSIKVNKSDVLIFSYLGYKTKEVSIRNYNNLDITLEESSESLDEIVTIGYGAQKLKSRTAGVQVMAEAEMSINNDNWNPGNSAIKYDEKTEENKSFDNIQIRKNFQETVFFYPQLRTDKNGKISFNFTMPEALTSWKLQLLAHTKNVKSATKTLQTVTQKELMIVPNAPRFLREGDRITFSAKISNLTNNTLNGFAKIILTDAITGKEITNELLSNIGSLPSGEMSETDRMGFSVNKEGNTNVSWNLEIPETVQAIQYKIVAKAGDFSDGEQNALPVLSNRILVTETVPMWVRSNQTKTFTLDKLKNTSSALSEGSSTTLKNHKLTLEMTSNPIWVAIQSLPYLMEYPYECAEQTFARYYANTLASFVANSNPRIQEVFNAWKSSDALLSNLEKNQELKSLIIQETPWLRDAQSETEQKKRIALLFDLNKMKNEQEKAIRKLKEIQMNSGGFPWFKGSRYENIYITQHIASGFGHLQKLGVTNFDASTTKMIEKAVQFLDEELQEQYQNLLKRAEEVKQKSKTKKEGENKYKDYLAKNNIGYFTIQYLYMRSFYPTISLNTSTKKAVDYYKNQTTIYWNEYNLYAKGQIALSLFRANKKDDSNKILKSLKENSITSNELGMYWKENTAGYYYYQAPVETQALMIETFSEIENDINTIDNLKIWLLKNKQTNRWKTTKATTEAVYALLLNGSDWVSITEMVDIQIGDQKIDPSKLENVKIEAGTGYFKTAWNGSEITPEMGKVTIIKKGNGIAWGGLYWQYFEDLDKITSAETPLKLNKKLFLKVNSDAGKELQEITDKTQLKVGDLVTVRIELRSDRDMEFIHMKDMRASGVEPIDVISRYKWQDNLGYYQSTKDAATNFFFDRIPKGIYVFEYDVRVNNAGNFSNGITTIQSMYAPEFSSHSKGLRIKVLKE